MGSSQAVIPPLPAGFTPIQEDPPLPPGFTPIDESAPTYGGMMKSAYSQMLKGPEASLTGIDRGVYKAVKGVALAPVEILRMQFEAAKNLRPSALIPGAPAGEAMYEGALQEGTGAVLSAQRGDPLAAMHQGMSAVPLLGPIYKDIAESVIQGDPQEAAGKVIGNALLPEIVPPVGRGLAKGAATAASAGVRVLPEVIPALKTIAMDKITSPVAIGTAATSMFGPVIGPAIGLGVRVAQEIKSQFGAKAAAAEAAATNKLREVVAQVDKISAAQNAEQIGMQNSVAKATAATETATARMIDKITNAQTGEFLKNRFEANKAIQAAKQARDKALTDLEAKIRAGQAAEELDAAHTRIIEEQAHVDAQTRLLKAYDLDEFKALQESQRALAAAQKAATKEDTASQSARGRAVAKATQEVETRKVRLIDRIHREIAKDIEAEQKGVKGKTEKAPAPAPQAPPPATPAVSAAAPATTVPTTLEMLQQEILNRTTPTTPTFTNLSGTPPRSGKSLIERMTSVSTTLARKGYSATEIETQLLKQFQKETPDPKLAKTLAGASNSPTMAGKATAQTPLVKVEEVAHGLARDGGSLIKIANYLITREGFTHVQAAKAARDAIRGLKKQTKAQKFEADQVDSIPKKFQLSDVKPYEP